MILYILVVIDFCGLVLNYYISKKDIFHPAVLFGFMNFASAVLCLAAKSMYGLEFHLNTILVLTSGLLIFTFFNFLCTDKLRLTIKKRTGRGKISKLEYVGIKNIWIIAFIGFELLVALYLIKYIRAVGYAYGGTSNFLAQMNLYDQISKFSSEELLKLHVSQSPIYSYGYPLCIAFSFFLIAVIVNNYYITRKIEKFKIIPIVILLGISLISGSRSFAFTIMTAILCDIVVIKRIATGKYSGRNMKSFVRFCLAGALVVIILTNLASIMGRVTQGGFKTFFTYLGGSFYNLDTYLQNRVKHSDMWGKETFVNLYGYLGTKFGVKKWIYDLSLPFIYINGICTGNVYTMYYQFILDFGYIAILPLTSIVAIFYCHIYRGLVDLKSTHPVFSLRLIIFSMFYNDVIMLMFSNRFYENLFRARSIRFYIWLLVIWGCYKKGVFSLSLKRRR